jgi:catechol 2,3-dioxygenase-like lactoylglutathione lyase family enzyme
MSFDRLLQVNMPVQDFDHALAFYRDILGLPVHAQREGLAFLSVGPVRVLLEATPESGGRFAHPGSVMYFPVEDIDAAVEELITRGVEFVHPPEVVSRNRVEETWMAFFSDGDWNTHAVVERRAIGSKEPAR